MPAGQVINGENGRVTVQGSDTGEVPCLTSWILEGSASLNERNNRCMKSNDDNAANQWSTQTLEGRGFSLELEFFWQEDEEIPASMQLDATNIGDVVDFELQPTDGTVTYAGNAIIESVSIPSNVNGDITCSVTLQGNGALQVFA